MTSASAFVSAVALGEPTWWDCAGAGGEGEKSGEPAWEPRTQPLHPLGGMALFLRVSLLPLGPHPHVCALSHLPRRVSLQLSGQPPDGPESLRSRPLGPGTGALGGRARRRARAGQRAWSVARLWPLGISLGPHRRPQDLASAFQHAEVAGAEAGRVFCNVNRPVFSQRQCSPPKLGCGALAGLEICAPGSIFQTPSLELLPPPAATHPQRPPRSAFVGPRSLRGPRLPTMLALPRPPLLFALGCPVAPPDPSGAHAQGRFLSFLFPTKSCCSKPRDETKTPRRTPKWPVER